MNLEQIAWIGGALIAAGIIAKAFIWFGEFTKQNDNPDDDKIGEKATYFGNLIRFYIDKIKAVLKPPGK